MKVTHYMRDKRNGNYSIEQIFEAIRNEIRTKIDFKVFYQQKPIDIKSILGARNYSGDVNHITGDSNLLIYGLPSKKTIITVHDIGHYEFTLKGIHKFIFGYLWFKLPLKKAKKITTISHFTKQKLISHFGIHPDKIEVIHNPVFPSFRYTPKEFNAERPVILQVGSGSNKNVKRLIEAAENLNCSLCFVRRPDENLVGKLKTKKIHYTWHSNVSMDELIVLYQNADIVFFASTYEGFGMPIIEAQAIGRPVITSNFAPMTEVGGNAALYVDPFDANAIKSAIQAIIANKDLRNSLVEKGKVNIQQFTISTIAQKYSSLYKSLA